MKSSRARVLETEAPIVIQTTQTRSTTGGSDFLSEKTKPVLPAIS